MSSSVEEVSARRVGTTLKDKWLLEQLIGVGGMASVYLGRHKIGRLEAIKILHHEVASSPQMRARFEQEAQAVNSFKHPGVVEVRDIDTAEDGSPFLVMELLEGESVADRIRRDPPLEMSDVLRIASATLDVLSAAHERGIIHRDIKPDNLFLTRDGALKVLDFGIARVRSSGGRKPMTGAGVTLGTMAYMPPEQARGQEIDGRADVYAVGATMFRMLARRAVHDASSEAERIMKVLGEPAPSIRSIVPTLAPDVALVVDRALAYDRADRHPDAKTMKADVDALARGESPPYARSAPPLPERPPASSFSFSSSASSDGDPSRRDAPTSVPRARAQNPSAAAGPAARSAATDAPASSAPTKLGVAPEVAPTRIALPESSVPTKLGVAPEVAPTRVAGDEPLPPDALPSARGFAALQDVASGTPTMQSAEHDGLPPLAARAPIVEVAMAPATVPMAPATAPMTPATVPMAPATAPMPRQARSHQAAEPGPAGLTPFGEPSGYVDDTKKRPQTTIVIVAIAAGVLVVSIALMLTAVIVVRSESNASGSATVPKTSPPSSTESAIAPTASPTAPAAVPPASTVPPRALAAPSTAVATASATVATAPATVATAPVALPATPSKKGKSKRR